MKRFCDKLKDNKMKYVKHNEISPETQQMNNRVEIKQEVTPKRPPSSKKEELTEKVISLIDLTKNGTALSVEQAAYVVNYTQAAFDLSLIHISEPTRRTPISY